MIVEYKIIEKAHIGLFQQLVNESILDGWIPHGGVAVLDLSYVQAMVKYDTEKAPE